MKPTITNHYNIGAKRPKLLCEDQTIFLPEEGWSYAHHPYIARFQERFYLVFSNGHAWEDDVGQRIMLSTAENFEEWSAPSVLVDSQPGDPCEAVLIPGGLYATQEHLVLYFTRFEYTEESIQDGHRKPGGHTRKNWCKFYMTTEDGSHWSEPVPIDFKGGNHAPRALQSGRLLSCGGITFPYSDNPDGIHGWVNVGIEEKYAEHNQPGGVSGGSTFLISHDNRRPAGLCESSFIQTDDGVIHMLMRSGTDYLWCTESRDDGASWSEPFRTDFTDNRTKFHFGRLPNGTFYYVGTPDPFPPRTRHLLVLSLSEDGLDYRRHFILRDDQYKGQYIGLDKNGIYGYPDTMTHNGYLYVAYSICKESIHLLRVPCDTL